MKRGDSVWITRGHEPEVAVIVSIYEEGGRVRWYDVSACNDTGRTSQLWVYPSQIHATEAEAFAAYREQLRRQIKSAERRTNKLRSRLAELEMVANTARVSGAEG